MSLASADFAIPSTRRVAVIGLGLMGTALTERLLEHGYTVGVWNRSREKAEPLLARGAEWWDAPLVQSEFILISLYSSEVVEEVLQRMEPDFRAGQIIIDTTTGEPARTAALAHRLAQRGVTYLDAPISGSSEQTRRGEATVMVGGPKSAFDFCVDLWPVLGRNVYHTGENGSAAQMKLVTNLVLGLNRAALAEGLAFAEAIGVSPSAALEVLSGSMAYSRAMDAKGQKMLQGDFSAQAKLAQHLKDVRIILQEAAAAGLKLPFSQTHADLMEKGIQQGLGELDNSVILRILQGKIPD
jgi:3-hydroxyisobutyrate dehydrogenase-like beta-hydroxyacid dehydrogenase